MGKYAYEERASKPFKKGWFYTLMPLNCFLVELFFICCVMAILRGASFSANMLAPLQAGAVGLALALLYGLVEWLCHRHWSMKWWHFPIAGYVIPLAVWAVFTLLAMTAWWSNRNSEDALFLKWFTLTMLIYLAIAAVFRLIAHVVYALTAKKMGVKKKERTEE